MRTLRHTKRRCTRRRFQRSPSPSNHSIALVLSLVMIEQADVIDIVCGAAEKPDLVPLLIVALAVERRRQDS